MSLAKEAQLVPMGHENVTHLIEFFRSKGLNLLDLVVLSGTRKITNHYINSSKIKRLIAVTPYPTLVLQGVV